MPRARSILFEGEQLAQLATCVDIFGSWRFVHNFLPLA